MRHKKPKNVKERFDFTDTALYIKSIASFLASQEPADQWRASAFIACSEGYECCILRPIISFPMQEHHLVIPKTARYYTLGELSKQTERVWLVVHGYGQLAGEFIKEFQVWETPGVAIVAPEGLSRFYTKGFFGTVGATWMTREDRLSEIKDYVNYLHTLFLKIKEEAGPGTEIHILAFSQGCSTVCRWVAEKSPDYAGLWLCSGSVPDDLDFAKFKKAIEKNPAHYFLGDADPFIGEKDILAFEERNRLHQLPLHVHKFKGEHVLNLPLIESLLDS